MQNNKLLIHLSGAYYLFPGQTPIFALSFCSGQLSGNLDVSRDNFFQKEFSDNFFPT